MKYYIELFNSGFITEQIDYQKHTVLLPKNCTSVCDLALVIEKEKFDEILRRARNANPMNEAILVTTHDAIASDEFSLYQIFVENSTLMDIYKDKRNAYLNIQEEDPNADSNSSNPFEALDTPDNDEEYENYKENVETIINDLTSAVDNDTFLSLFDCSENEQESNIETLSTAFASSVKYLTVDEQKFIFSVLLEVLLTNELNSYNILEVYKLLSDRCLNNKDYNTIDSLFSIFLEKLYPDE